MTNDVRITRLRHALDEGNVEEALKLLALVRAENYPKALLRPLLASCNPGLDESFLDLDLVPSSLFIAARFPGALDSAPLDSRRLLLTHGCGLTRFLKDHLNEVLRGDRPLYDDLPALDINSYRQLVQLSPVRCGWLQRMTVLECLALEATHGVEAKVSALNRWRPSRHDVLLERPWIWINAVAGQAKADLQVHDLAGRGIREITNPGQASALIHEAADQVLSGGATYLLSNRADLPPASWTFLLQGLCQQQTKLLQQIGETRHGLEEIRPVRFSEERALLAIDAVWLARRNPRQVLAFLHHWLNGPPAKWRTRSRLELRRHLEPLIQPTVFRGVLVLAACQRKVQELGLEQLERRATKRAIEGGFARGIVLQLNACPGPSIRQQLEALATTSSGTAQIVAFMGAEDRPARGAWDHLFRHLSIKDDVLLCSDEELQWSTDPGRIGQRQFAGQPTLFRIISRGHLPGLVAAQAAHITALELQENYLSLHGLIKDLGLQWMANRREIAILPQALLRRSCLSNPTVLTISTCNQRNIFSADQLLELDAITRRRAAPWLQPEGRLERGTRAGSFELQRNLQSEDKVSVIIPFRNQAGLTRACVLSLLEHETTIPFEFILVDNGSTEPEAINLAMSLTSSAQTLGVKVTGIRDDRPFNFSSLNNSARHFCTGNFLLFLNNDIRFESSAPLKHLLNPFALRCTGAVGSRLIYEDGTIQHQGLVAAALQSHDILSAGKGLRPGLETDPFTALVLQEEWSAATAACLVVRSKDFDRLEGFDENFTVAYNDVDLCWRLAVEDLAVIVTPTPRILHAESKSRGEDTAGEKRQRLARESGALRRRYPRYFHMGDPLYSRFLNPGSHRFDPSELPARPLENSRAGLIYSWTNPDFYAGIRPFTIYVHYDSKGDVRPDIIEQLKAYRGHSDVAFVSASTALINQPATINKLQEICDIVLVRHNEGYDFGSWQAGIFYCQEYLKLASRLILTNDSCYGPLHSFDSLFRRLLDSHSDVIGLTDSTTIHHHLQSYFIAYSRRVLTSPIFWRFWQEIKIWPSKVDLVRAYEVDWSDILVKAGFQLEALYLQGEHGNATHTHWRELLEEHQFPFIKTELLRVNPIQQDISGWQDIASKINPKVAQMITDHLG